METETATQPAPLARAAPSLGFIATSVVGSAVGVVLAELVDNVGLAIGGWLAGRDPVLYNNGVVYQAPGSDLAYAGGLIAALVVGSVFLLLYPGSKRYDAARLTTLWIVLHCFREGFVQLAGIPFFPDSAAAAAHAGLDVPAGLDLVLSVAGVVGLLSVALASAPAFLAYARRQSEIATPPARFLFTAKLALVAGVAGPLLTVPFFLPDERGFVRTLPLFGLFTAATVLAAVGTRGVRAGSEQERRGFSWLPVAWLVVLLVIFQLLLRRGLVVPPDLSDPLVEPFGR